MVELGRHDNGAPRGIVLDPRLAEMMTNVRISGVHNPRLRETALIAQTMKVVVVVATEDVKKSAG